MGCAGSTPKVDENSKKLKKPKSWKHIQPITPAQLKHMRDEFWDMAPHYGGQKEIWDALKVAAESDLALAQTIVDSAGIIVSNPDMTLCYDERGEYAIIPKFMIFLFLHELFKTNMGTDDSCRMCQIRAAEVCFERANKFDPRRLNVHLVAGSRL